jgi:predicted PurR-regulated permease PerM
MGALGDTRHWNRCLLIAGAVAVMLWLTVQAWGVLLPFALALALAYLIAPLVDRLARVLPRTAAILLVYLLGLGACGGLGSLLVPAAGHQIHDLLANWPLYSDQLHALVRDAQAWFATLNLPPEVDEGISSAWRTAVGGLGTALQGTLVNTVQIVTRTAVLVCSLLVIPFWLFYVLQDKDLILARLQAWMPEAARADVQQVGRIVGHVLNSYVRGQVILGCVVGLATTIGLLGVGAPYWLLLGVLYGLTEVVPIVGPLVGAVPGLVVAVLTGDWGLVLKVLLVYILVQQLENNLLVPRIQGAQVHLHPALIILIIIVGGQVAGLWGVLVGVPLAAVSRNVYLYAYRRWGEGAPPEVAARGLIAARPLPPAPGHIKPAASR